MSIQTKGICSFLLWSMFLLTKKHIKCDSFCLFSKLLWRRFNTLRGYDFKFSNGKAHCLQVYNLGFVEFLPCLQDSFLFPTEFDCDFEKNQMTSPQLLVRADGKQHTRFAYSRPGVDRYVHFSGPTFVYIFAV